MTSLAPVSSPLVLDVRSLSGAGHAETVFAAFDKLRPGEAMVVITDHAPAGFLRHLQSNRPGLFEWSPLEMGPEVWRTEVTRRDAPLGAKRHVNEALSWDHDRLDALDRRAFEARAASDYVTALGLFGEFDRGLRRHIRFEEEILFPEFEERAGLPPHAGPTAVMRAEHREIEAVLEALCAVVGLPGASAETLREDLKRILGWHNEKEENILYPGADKLLTDEESDALVRRIQSS